MKFVVDGMLGSLARWLRILGKTAVYSSNNEDTALLALANSGQMVLLTGDRELFRRALTKNVQAVLVSAQSEEERLAQVSKDLQIPLIVDMEKTSCPECGGNLHRVPKQHLTKQVPESSLRLYDQFWQCTNSSCNKVYWKGSHWKQINETLAKAKKILQTGKDRDRLNLSEGSLLVYCARDAIEAHLTGKRYSPAMIGSPCLREKRGVFVTLVDTFRGHGLRGCIGNPFPDKPLLEFTLETAVEAATLDPRFSPLTKDELGRVIVEVSVLTPLKRVEVPDPFELSKHVLVGKSGLMVEGHGMKGMLLPQVAVEEGFDSEEFLSQCCLKAGMLPDAWLTGDVRVSTFEAQVFSEDKPNGQVSERELSSLRSAR